MLWEYWNEHVSVISIFFFILSIYLSSFDLLLPSGLQLLQEEGQIIRSVLEGY